MSRRRYRSRSKNRRKTFAEQQGLCFYCGNNTNYEKWTIDHKDPISRGGSRLKENRIGACYNCNHAKNNMTLSEFLQTDYFSNERRAALGFIELPTTRYKVAKKNHVNRLTMYIRTPIHVRICNWFIRVGYKIRSRFLTTFDLWDN